MRIVAWNCNMGFHGKVSSLMELEPSVVIIPECASPVVLKEKSPLFTPYSGVWIGKNRNKGLGVFSFGDYSIKRHESFVDDLHLILPIEVRGPQSFNLLAVWDFSYLMPSRTDEGHILRALRHYRNFLTSAPAVIAGDFNNHPIWDKPGKINNHVNIVNAMAELGLKSAYHAFHKIEIGNEVEPTLYWRDRKKDGPKYHIDYCFIPESWKSRLRQVSIGSFDPWIKLSDHMPLIVDLEF